MAGRRVTPEGGWTMGEREETARDGMAGDVKGVFSDDALGLTCMTGETGRDTGDDQDAGVGEEGSGAGGEKGGTEAGTGSAGG